MFLGYVHIFRAIAIVTVVANHAVWAFTWSDSSVTMHALSDLLDDATVLFVFIAGFLFEHLAGKFQYRDYLTKKFKNVILPYLVLALPGALRDAATVGLYSWYPALRNAPYPYRVGWFMAVGGAGSNRALWFIPMITIIYLISPALKFLADRPRLYWVLILLLPLSALGHRTTFPNLDTLQLFAYFLSVYVCGMFVSRQRQRIEKLLEPSWPYVLAAGLLGVVVLTAFASHHGNYEGAHLFSQEHGLIDWMFVQKLVLCFGLLGMVRRYENVLAAPLASIADSSFTIYFVHCYFLAAATSALTHLGTRLGNQHLDDGSVPVFLIALAYALGLSMLFAKIAQRLFGPRSRSLVGS